MDQGICSVRHGHPPRSRVSSNCGTGLIAHNARQGDRCVDRDDGSVTQNAGEPTLATRIPGQSWWSCSWRWAGDGWGVDDAAACDGCAVLSGPCLHRLPWHHRLPCELHTQWRADHMSRYWPRRRERDSKPVPTLHQLHRCWPPDVLLRIRYRQRVPIICYRRVLTVAYRR